MAPERGWTVGVRVTLSSLDVFHHVAPASQCARGSRLAEARRPEPLPARAGPSTRACRR